MGGPARRGLVANVSLHARCLEVNGQLRLRDRRQAKRAQCRVGYH